MNNIKTIVDLAREAMPVAVPTIGVMFKDGVSSFKDPKIQAAIFTAITVPALAAALEKPEPISGYTAASFENYK
jgi:hypothetical protein